MVFLSSSQREQRQQPQAKKTPKTMSMKSLQEKAEEINLVLLQPDVDLWKLRALALSEGGLVNDTLRKRAWPKLVGLYKYYHHNQPPEWTNDNNAANSNHNLYANRTPMSSPSRKQQQRQKPIGEHDVALATPQQQNQNQTIIEFDFHNESETTWQLMVESMDAAQIERDVARCTWHLLTGNQRSRRHQYHRKTKSKKVAALLKKKQRRLANLINLTLVESYDLAPTPEERLRYYQGYHDVACIFLHALGGGNTGPTTTSGNNSSSSVVVDKESHQGLDLPAKVLCQVSYSHFRDSMRNNFMSLQTALKIALFPLLEKLDPAVHDQLKYCDMEPFFCLSWVLTWFAHDVRDTALVKRLFDAFLCSHPLFPLYVSMAMMLHPINKRLILQTDCDFAALHQCLASLPRNSCRVGWKQRCDGEFGFQDDEFDNDTATVNDDHTATTSLDSNFWDGTTMTGSMASTTGGGGGVEDVSSDHKVPFDVLIQTALQYMARFPPRCLVDLAKDYYNNKNGGEDWVMGGGDPCHLDNISLLCHPPTWALASTAKADWVLKQRVRQDLGLKATSRKDRRRKLVAAQKGNNANNAVDSNNNNHQNSWDAKPLVDTDYLNRHRRTLAVIAAGQGPGPEDELLWKRQRRMLAGAVMIGVIAALMAAYHYPPAASSTTTTVSHAPTSSSSKKGLKKFFAKLSRNHHRHQEKRTFATSATATSTITTQASPIMQLAKSSVGQTLSSSDSNKHNNIHHTPGVMATSAAGKPTPTPSWDLGICSSPMTSFWHLDAAAPPEIIKGTDDTEEAPTPVSPPRAQTVPKKVVSQGSTGTFVDDSTTSTIMTSKTEAVMTVTSNNNGLGLSKFAKASAVLAKLTPWTHHTTTNNKPLFVPIKESSEYSTILSKVATWSSHFKHNNGATTMTTSESEPQKYYGGKQSSSSKPPPPIVMILEQVSHSLLRWISRIWLELRGGNNGPDAPAATKRPPPIFLGALRNMLTPPATKTTTTTS